MTVYSPKFNVNDYELRGETNSFLTQDQFGASLDIQYRTPAQLDWLGQLLGWSGTNYWSAFSASIDQKRQLLSGSYGVYNGYIYPEVVEVRNWDNIVVIKNNQFIKEGQTFLLNDSEYTLESATLKGDNLELYFGELPQQFYDDISSTEQLKVTAVESITAPFRRNFVGVSADRSFNCEVKDGKITLYPDHDTKKSLPYLLNVFFAGSRYYFNLPVILIISEDYYLKPVYNFDKEIWQIDIPCELENINTGLSARLDYEGSFLIVNIKQWQDPSDWLNQDKIKYYLGAWGNKGGYLPFNFVFDSLSLHGFDEKKSITLDTVEREVGFDTLLNLVYQQQVAVNETPPSDGVNTKAWWDSANRRFMFYSNDPINCGPWIESNYPQGLDEEIIPDLIFPSLSSFRGYSDELREGLTVEILDASGLSLSDKVLGVIQPLFYFFRVKLLRLKDDFGWVPLEFIYDNEPSFSGDALFLPANVKVKIDNSEGLTREGSTYSISNLSFTISEPHPVTLMKGSRNNDWFLSPPRTLKYIGNTRLYGSPVNGEMQWDFTNPDLYNRTASIFSYTGWEYNSGNWELVGEWFNINSGNNGIITSLTNLAGGSGYVDGIFPGVELSGGSGYGAKADIFVSSGSVVFVSLTDGGQGYSTGGSLSAPLETSGSGSPFSIEVDEVEPTLPPEDVNFGTVLVYCDDNLLTEGETYLSENFQFSYFVDSYAGKFIFNYSPRNYEGSVKFPKITISDSLTSAYTSDISSLIFNGLIYRTSPNVADSETLLRVWKSTPLFCVDNLKDSTLLSYPNFLVADENNGPSDINWERYFIRLPPSYQRDGKEWQQVNLTCQDFGLWGSPTLPEDMVCPSGGEKPDIYDEVVAQPGNRPSNYVYSEPYLYSVCIPNYGYPEDYENSMVIPVPHGVRDGYEEGKIVKYEPLHERRVDTESLMGKGYGDWEGSYFRISDCSNLNGHFVNDLGSGSLESIAPPVWDASIYKLPNTCIIDNASSKVDANHFKVGYAFFVADLSAAEEAVFDFN